MILMEHAVHFGKTGITPMQHESACLKFEGTPMQHGSAFRFQTRTLMLHGGDTCFTKIHGMLH